MKKILFILLCVLSFVGIVCADTQIEYEWGKYAPADDAIYNDFVFKNNQMKALFFSYDGLLLINMDEKASQLDQKDLDDLSFKHSDHFSFVDDELLHLTYDSDEDAFILNVYDMELNLLNTQLVEGSNSEDSRFLSLKSENDKYFVWGFNIYDKKEKSIVNFEDVIMTAPSFEVFKEDNSDENFIKCFNEVLGGTHLLQMLMFFSGDENIPNDIVDFNYQNGYLSIIYYDENEDKYGVTIFDKDMELVFDDLVSSISIPHFLFRNDFFYIFENILVSEEDEDGNPVTQLMMYEYNYKGEKNGEFDLTMSSDSELRFDGNLIRWGREIYNVVPTDDGFLITTHTVVSLKAMDPTINEDDVINGTMPTIQKYSFVYNVETKENDNGTILVDKTISKTGEEITYVVEPKKGFRLDKVIITDEAGNVIEIKDNKFTMPSSNVIIEAVFVVDNPNTGVFISIGASLLFIIAAVGIVVLNRTKVQKYE